MNMKKKLMISGTTLVAAMTLGTVATVHAATYDEMEAQWEKIAPMNQGAGQWLDLESAAGQGDPQAQKLMEQVNGKSSQKNTTNATSTTPATSGNTKSGQNAGAGNSAQSSLSNSVTGNEGTQATATKSTPSASTPANTPVAPATTNSTSANNGMKVLPQTGNDNTQAVAATGLGIAALAGMFGFGHMKKRA